MRKFNLLLGILFLLSACAPKKAELLEIAFNQPQPDGIKNLKEIPLSYYGKYIDNDSNFLMVDKTYMILKSVYEFKISKQEADTSKDCHIENKYLVISGSKEKLPFTLKADTLYVKQYFTDTVYDLRKDIIRKFRGFLIMNKQFDELWNVAIVSAKSGELKIRKFRPDDLFEKLSKLSNAEVQTDKSKKILVKKFLKPTRKQFENLMNYKDSLSVDVYKKTNLPNHSTN